VTVHSAGFLALIAVFGLACEPTTPAPSAVVEGNESGHEAKATLGGPDASRAAVAESARQGVADGPAASMGAEVDAAYAIESALDSADPAERILDLEAEGDGLDTLMRAAADSADPAVRETAVVALGDSDDPRALDALIAASFDPEPAVVLAALEQLRWSDDRLARDAIRRLRDSSDPAIARAAGEAIDE